MSSKNVAKKNETAMAVPDYIKDSGRGQEGVGTEDVLLPRITLLQQLSPQINKKKPEYVEGAEAGMMMNSVTKELYDEIEIVPVFFRKEWVIWKDRDAGGGSRGAFPGQAEAMAELNKYDDAALLEVKDTANHFVLIRKPDGSIEEAVISMSGGTMRSSRQLNSLVRIAGGDRFSRMYKVTSMEVNGAKGAYLTFNFEMIGWAPEDMYHQAEELYEAIRAGQVDVKREEETAEVEAEEF